MPPKNRPWGLWAMPDIAPPSGEPPSAADAEAYGWPCQPASPVMATGNLLGFLHWERLAPKREAIQAILQVHAIEHQHTLTGAVEVYPQLRHGNLRILPCQEAACRRCLQGIGGYKFDFVDPRWTGERALAGGFLPAVAKALLHSQGCGPLIPLNFAFTELDHFHDMAIQFQTDLRSPITGNGIPSAVSLLAMASGNIILEEESPSVRHSLRLTAFLPSQ